MAEGKSMKAALMTLAQRPSFDPTLPPVPLLASSAQPTPYPVEAFPQLIRDAVLAIAELVQAAPALAGQCVIGAIVHIAQTRVKAPAIHGPDGMPCSLFLLTLAESGDRKTDCRKLAFKVIDEVERESLRLWRQENTESLGRSAKLSRKDREKFLQDHPLPREPRSQYSDATFERIAGDMIRGTSAASWDTDEGGQVLGGASLKSDTRAATLGGLVKGFDDGTFERSRSLGNLEGSGSAFDRRLSIHLLAQPVTVANALADPLLQGQGFLPRFLFASPATLAGTRLITVEQMTRKSCSDQRLVNFWARCLELMASPQYINSETGEVQPPVIELSADALDVWVEYYNKVETEQGLLGEFASLRPFASRAGELARRLAAVFACFEGKAEIDGDCMSRAIALVQYSLQEWSRYIDSGAVKQTLKQAAELMEWFEDPKRAGHWREFHVNKLGKSGPPIVRKAKLRDEILNVLLMHRQLLTDDGKTFRINMAAEIAAPEEF